MTSFFKAEAWTLFEDLWEVTLSYSIFAVAKGMSASLWTETLDFCTAATPEKWERRRRTKHNMRGMRGGFSV